jgi:hypothetical protein
MTWIAFTWALVSFPLEPLALDLLLTHYSQGPINPAIHYPLYDEPKDE